MSNLERSADALLAQKAVQSSNYERLQSSIDQQTRGARTLVMTGKMAASDLCRLNEETKEIEARGDRLVQRLDQLKDSHILVTHSTNSETEKALAFFKQHTQSVDDWNVYADRVATALSAAKAGEQLERANKRALRLVNRVSLSITGIRKLYHALIASSMVSGHHPITISSESSQPVSPLYNLYLNRISNSGDQIATSSAELSDANEKVIAYIKNIDTMTETMKGIIVQLHSKKNTTEENTLAIVAASEAKSKEVCEKEAILSVMRERKEKREQTINAARERLASSNLRRRAAQQEKEEASSKLLFVKKEISEQVARIQSEVKDAQSRLLEKQKIIRTLSDTLREKEEAIIHQKRVMLANSKLRYQQEKHTEAVKMLKTEAFEKIAALRVKERESEMELKHEERRRDEISLIIQKNRLEAKIELQQTNERRDAEKFEYTSRETILRTESDEWKYLGLFMTQVVAFSSAEVGSRGQVMAEEDQGWIELELLHSIDIKAAHDLELKRQHPSPDMKVVRSMDLSGAYDSPNVLKNNIISESGATRVSTLLSKNFHTPLPTSDGRATRSLLVGGAKPMAYLRPVQPNANITSALLDDVVAPNPTKRIHGISQKAQVPRLSTGAIRPSSGVTKSVLRDESEGSVISLFRDASVASQHPSVWQLSSLDVTNTAMALKGIPTSQKKMPAIITHAKNGFTMPSKEIKVVSPANNNANDNDNAPLSDSDDDDTSILEIANCQTKAIKEQHHTHVPNRQAVAGKRAKRSPKTEVPINVLMGELCEGTNISPSSANIELPSPSPRRPPFRRTEPLPHKPLPQYASRKTAATDPRKRKPSQQHTDPPIITLRDPHPTKGNTHVPFDGNSSQSTTATTTTTSVTKVMTTASSVTKCAYPTNITQALMDMTNKTPQSKTGTKKSSKVSTNTNIIITNTQEVSSPLSTLSASRRMLALVGGTPTTDAVNRGAESRGDNLNMRNLSMDNICSDSPSSISMYSTQLKPRRIVAPSSSSEVGDDLF